VSVLFDLPGYRVIDAVDCSGALWRVIIASTSGEKTIGNTLTATDVLGANQTTSNRRHRLA
jgi:hypothetical protein